MCLCMWGSARELPFMPPFLPLSNTPLTCPAQSLVSHRLQVRSLDGASLLADRSVIEARVQAGKAAGGAARAAAAAAAIAGGAAAVGAAMAEEALVDPQADADRRIRLGEEAARALESQRRRSDVASSRGSGGGGSRGQGVAATEPGEYGDSLAAIKKRAFV